MRLTTVTLGTTGASEKWQCKQSAMGGGLRQSWESYTSYSLPFPSRQLEGNPLAVRSFLLGDFLFPLEESPRSPGIPSIPPGEKFRKTELTTPAVMAQIQEILPRSQKKDLPEAGFYVIVIAGGKNSKK